MQLRQQPPSSTVSFSAHVWHAHCFSRCLADPAQDQPSSLQGLNTLSHKRQLGVRGFCLPETILHSMHAYVTHLMSILRPSSKRIMPVVFLGTQGLMVHANQIGSTICNKAFTCTSGKSFSGGGGSTIQRRLSRYWTESWIRSACLGGSCASWGSPRCTVYSLK